LKRSPFRSKLKIVKVENFEPAVRAWVVHRPPAGRLAAPIKAFRDALALELREIG
jgi:hypothetical protein